MKTKKTSHKENNEIQKLGGLLSDIKMIIHKARDSVFNAVNTEMLKAYYEVGKRIVEEEQKGKHRSEYGENLLENISLGLGKEFGRGFDASNLRRMRKFYLVFEKWETVSPKLTWSHYCELATSGISNKMFISKYTVYLPKEEELENEVRKLL